ncbi:PAP/OAS1 substrate-binding domain-containing protein, partial [Backusella circina FSU 941]
MTKITPISNQEWLTYLLNNRVIEDADEKYKREQVLLLLNAVITSFKETVANRRNYRPEEISCFLSLFGSFGLGGYTANADIDLVLLCSSHIKLNDFFNNIPHLLRTQPTTRDVESVKRANVPIIKCMIDSVPVDISFVRLRQTTPFNKNIDLLDDNLLDGLDKTCLASMDGPRVNRYIMESIKPSHLMTFQSTLQCIKHWASQRMIYSKPLGYLNGGSWSLLLLKVYMDKKKEESVSISELLYSFFNTWAGWPWPTPINLNSYIPGFNGSQVNIRDLTDFDDAYLPIMTPCYPVVNASPFVKKSTFDVILRELKRACAILATPVKPEAIMHKLFNPLDCIRHYTHFLRILICSTTPNGSDVWKRKMGNEIPRLVELLEYNTNIDKIQPLTKPVSLVCNYTTLDEKEALENGATVEEAKNYKMAGQLHPGTMYITNYVVGLTFKIPETQKVVDASPAVEGFLNILNSKRHQKDRDVKWSVSAMNRREASELFEQQQ